MADNSNRYIAKDGKYYDSRYGYYRANKVVEEQEQQTKLLAQQNQLLAQQAILQEKQEAIRLQQEREKMILQEKIEREKLEHEKEMRLRKLFDEISISFDVYKNFEEGIFEGFKDEEIELEGLDECEEVIEELKDVNKEIEDYHEIICTHNTKEKLYSKKVKYASEYIRIENFVNDVIKVEDLTADDLKKVRNQNEEICELIEKYKSEKKKIKKIIQDNTKKIVIASSIFLILFLCSESIRSMTPSLLIVIIGILIIVAVKKSQKLDDVKKLIHASINLQMAETEMQLIKKQQELQQEGKTLQEKLDLQLKEVIERKLKIFYEFRIKHYNFKMENLFYDVGLVDKCKEREVDFNSIDKSKVLGEGTFEEYFDFFSNFEQIYYESQEKE